MPPTKRNGFDPAKAPTHLLSVVSDGDLPWQHRAAIIHDLLSHPTPENEMVIKEVCDRLVGNLGDVQLREKTGQLTELLKEMQEGPRRQGVFIELAPAEGGGQGYRQALVVMDDGTHVYTAVPDLSLAKALRPGDRVVLDGKGRAVLHRASFIPKTGETAVLERALDDRHIEINFRGSERMVVFAAQELMDQIRDGSVTPGAAVVFNSRQALALMALPAQDGLSHFKFLDTSGLPRAGILEEMGARPKCIEEVTEHIRVELSDPGLRRRYGLHRSTMKLLAGPSGTGKTLAVQIIHRQMYDVMSAVTGVPVQDLPPRVFRFRSSKVLSMWLGESDKNLDRLFDEIELMAGQPFVGSDGRRHELPVLVVIEEADGLGRARGDEAVYDRLLTTALQRLDGNREEVRNRLIIFLATTNEPQIIDPAFLRRVGGSIETFGRLNRSNFASVLHRQLQRVGPAADHGCSPEELRGRYCDRLTDWLFSPNSADPGLVELTYAGSTATVVKRRSDFLTGALVERSVQQAAAEACAREYRGFGESGVSLEQLMRAFHQQIRGLISQLREQNVAQYCDLPDGVRVASLRRLPQPSLLPVELQRP